MAASRMALKTRTALVTGAAGGIGRGVALALAGRGARLALADIDEAGLEDTKRQAQALGASARAHRLDVADREAVAAFPQAMAREHGGLDVLVNNAGVALGGAFEQVSEADFDWLFAINFFGVVRMTRAFLPMLRSSDEARLVNVSSVYGLVAPAGQSAYAASKFAVRGFSEALRRELKGSTVGVTVVHPGGVNTSIARNARLAAAVSPEEAERGRRVAQTLLRMDPARAGEIIVDGVERRRSRVLVGRDARLLSLIARLSPVEHFGVLERRLPG